MDEEHRQPLTGWQDQLAELLANRGLLSVQEIEHKLLKLETELEQSNLRYDTLDKEAVQKDQTIRNLKLELEAKEKELRDVKAQLSGDGMAKTVESQHAGCQDKLDKVDAAVAR
ncbi:hypothetical protein AAVH_24228 [Aphelenchoides avenae]|nr:hypothetical protein AAVH_24228 [Aphelenchus avenae]